MDGVAAEIQEELKDIEQKIKDLQNLSQKDLLTLLAHTLLEEEKNS